MLLRICLILAILGGGAAVAVNFVMVQKAIVTTIKERDSEKDLKKAALTKLDKTQKDLGTATNSLAATNKKLATTTTQLGAANSQIATLNTQTTNLQASLTKAVASRDQAQGELTEWHQLHLTPEQVMQKTNELEKTKMQFAGATLESKLLGAKLEKATNDLIRLTGRATNDVVIMRAGLKGKVVAVDPKYDFVILDIGEDQGALARGIMMVARDGQLIGKVRISRVTSNQSVADIMPADLHGEVMEGDEVIY